MHIDIEEVGLATFMLNSLMESEGNEWNEYAVIMMSKLVCVLSSTYYCECTVHSCRRMDGRNGSFVDARCLRTAE